MFKCDLIRKSHFSYCPNYLCAFMSYVTNKHQLETDRVCNVALDWRASCHVGVTFSIILLPPTVKICWEKTNTLATFELSHHIGQVGLQFGVSSELQAHVIVGDSGERLWRVNASLVQDAVDAECCRFK